MRPPERTRIRVSPGAPALLAVFVWLSSPEVLGAVLLAALCHELGHYAVLRSRGGWGKIRTGHFGRNIQSGISSNVEERFYVRIYHGSDC